MGIVKDNQNPHSELTANRSGGALPRQDQMARAMICGLVKMARSSGEPSTTPTQVPQS